LVLLAVVEFDHPARLLWLALLPVLVYFAWRSATATAAWRAWGSLACRCLSVTLLILAFAGIALRATSDKRHLLLLVDRSRSVQGDGQQMADGFIEAIRSARRHHEVSVWEFADRPQVAETTRSETSPPLNPMVSDPAAAVRMAAASIPDDRISQIILLTDGLETQGQVARAALGAESPIDVVPLPPFSEPDACLIELHPASNDPITGQVRLEAIARSNHAGSARCEISIDGLAVAEQTVELTPGDNRFFLSIPTGQDRQPLVQAILQSAWDSIPENNGRRLRLDLPKAPRILLITDHSSQDSALHAALAGNHLPVDTEKPDRLPDRLADLEDYDLIVFADVEPQQIDDSVYDRLEDYLHQTGGLIVVGGEKTFGHSVYHQSRLEELLPVTAAAAIETRQPVLAIMLVIDRSQTMEEENRMELARLAAQQSIELLEPHDLAGVMAFSDGPMWIAELESVADKQSLLKRIDTLRPGGQTYMYDAVERAFLGLIQAVADRRTMILLTDGVPAPGDYLEIAQRMARHGVTLSTVSLGQEAEQDLLIEMARIAGGRHYHCDDPRDMPGVMVRETRAATVDDAPEQFEASVFRALPGLPFEGTPQLMGYAVTNPKPEAEQLLMAAGRDPLLAWWPLGSGIAVAVTSDLIGPNNRAWQHWSGHTAFWQRLVRHAARPPALPCWQLSAQRQGNTARVRLADVPPQGSRDLPDAIRLILRTPDGTQRDLEPLPLASGHFEATFEAVDLGEYRIEATVESLDRPSRTFATSLLIDYPDELRLQAQDTELLPAIAATTSGRFDPSVETLLEPDGRTVPRRYQPWRMLLISSMLLIIADLALRRWRR
jgi:Ca-activated chloride channel homolog